MQYILIQGALILGLLTLHICLHNTIRTIYHKRTRSSGSSQSLSPCLI